MNFDDFDHHDQEPIQLPIEGVPAVRVTLKVAAGTNPSPLQLELVEMIRQHFPRLWAELLQELQTDWGESYDVINRPAEAFKWLGILVPPWEGDGLTDLGHDESTIPSIENYFWEMGLGLAFGSGCHASFEGVKLTYVDVEW